MKSERSHFVQSRAERTSLFSLSIIDSVQQEDDEEEEEKRELRQASLNFPGAAFVLRGLIALLSLSLSLSTSLRFLFLFQRRISSSLFPFLPRQDLLIAEMWR